MIRAMTRRIHPALVTLLAAFVAILLAPGIASRGRAQDITIDAPPGVRGPGARPAEPAPPRPLSPPLAALPPLPDSLAFEPGVKDPVFALLLGLVYGGHFGTITGDRLQAELSRAGAKSKLPYQTVRSLTRRPVSRHRRASIELEFNRKLDLPIPYSILGYNPGSFTATEQCLFREWMLGPAEFVFQRQARGGAYLDTVRLENVHLFGLREGQVNLEIDGWIDRLLGGAIDDTRVTGLMLCRHEGNWVGFALGYNKDGEGRSGAFSFAEDRILFPTPERLKGIARLMRTRMEFLMEVWDQRDRQGSPASLSP